MYSTASIVRDFSENESANTTKRVLTLMCSHNIPATTVAPASYTFLNRA